MLWYFTLCSLTHTLTHAHTHKQEINTRVLSCSVLSICIQFQFQFNSSFHLLFIFSIFSPSFCCCCCFCAFHLVQNPKRSSAADAVHQLVAPSIVPFSIICYNTMPRMPTTTTTTTTKRTKTTTYDERTNAIRFYVCNGSANRYDYHNAWNSRQYWTHAFTGEGASMLTNSSCSAAAAAAAALQWNLWAVVGGSHAPLLSASVNSAWERESAVRC